MRLRKVNKSTCRFSLPFLIEAENSCPRPLPGAPATVSNTYQSSERNTDIKIWPLTEAFNRHSKFTMTMDSITVWRQCCTATFLFSRCALFQLTFRERPHNPTCCNNNNGRIRTCSNSTLHYFAVCSLLMCCFLPVNDVGSVELLSGFFQLLLCTTSHLLRSSRVKQRIRQIST